MSHIVLRGILGLGLGAAFGLGVFVLIGGITGYVVGPIWGAPLFFLYSLVLSALAGLPAALIIRLPASVIVRQLLSLLAGGILGLALGLVLGQWAHDIFESNPDVYFSMFRTERKGQPVASVDIVIVTSIIGMVFATLVGTRWCIRPIMDIHKDGDRRLPPGQNGVRPNV